MAPPERHHSRCRPLRRPAQAGAAGPGSKRGASSTQLEQGGCCRTVSLPSSPAFHTASPPPLSPLLVVPNTRRAASRMCAPPGAASKAQLVPRRRL